MNNDIENTTSLPEGSSVTDDSVSHTENGTGGKETQKKQNLLGDIYEIVEMLAIVTTIVMVTFAFIARLNIVEGDSMQHTLAPGDALVVSDLFYSPEPGDIVIIQKINAYPYTEPIVKRVIATENQVVDIDFDTWTLTVDGKVVDEPYRYLSEKELLTGDYSFPITVPEGEIFVLGDNRNGSADSRQIEIGTIDERCIIGKALGRIYPFSEAGLFKDPYQN